MEIPLGSKVKDITTGFTGHVTSRTEQLNGCVQYYVEPVVDKKTNEIPKGYSIDVESLEVLPGGVAEKLEANKAKLKGVVPIKAVRARTGGHRRARQESKPS